MEQLRRRLAHKEEHDVNGHGGSIKGERATPPWSEALFEAFPGVAIFGDRVTARLNEDDLPCHGTVLGRDGDGSAGADEDNNLVSKNALARALAARTRWPGVRDPLDKQHDVALALLTALERTPGAIPDPDPMIVSALLKLGCTVEGRIVSCRGVPIPAGAAQVAYFIVLRWRPLFSPLADPARIYRGNKGYDSRHVTDEVQASILLVSTDFYRQSLVSLQENHPNLFVAVWMREVEEVERIAAQAQVETLPPSYSRTRLNRRRCLLIAFDLMSEHERAFEILTALSFYGGVTREGMSRKSALLCCTTMTAVRAVNENTRRHFAAGAAHLRTVHPTMNEKRAARGVHPVFEAVKSSFEQSAIYIKPHHPVTMILGELPTRYFLGVEPARLIPVMLIHMRETMARLESLFWLSPRKAQDTVGGCLETRSMSLSIIITSNICVPTARAMMRDDGLLLDSLWLRQQVGPLVSNPGMEAEVATAAKLKDDETLHDLATIKIVIPASTSKDDANFKNSCGKARHRAGLCSSPAGKPGWTQGFRPEAWRQPRAELSFLRNCSTYVRFDARHTSTCDEWNREAGRHSTKAGRRMTAADLHTGLPRHHPVENVHDRFRPWLDSLQVANVVTDVKTSEQWRRRETFLIEIALMLPALCAITDDPQLHEHFWVDRESRNVRLAREGAWNCG